MEPNLLHDNERLDDLLADGLRIIQSDEVFSFSMDAVLLARFCSVQPKGKIIDLCTGNGVIPLLLSTRTKADVWGIEIQERLADMAQRSIRTNGLERQITVLRQDLKDSPAWFGHGAFDLVTVNPPYLPVAAGEQNTKGHRAAARHEMFCTLEDVVGACSRLVRYGGKVAMVHRPGRLADILCMMREYRLEPKRIRFVHPRAEDEANMVLVEAIKEGKPDIRLLPPLIVYKNREEYGDELLQIYYGKGGTA